MKKNKGIRLVPISTRHILDIYGINKIIERGELSEY